MIAHLYAHPAGAAIAIQVHTDGTPWRLLRHADAESAAADDPAAVLVDDGDGNEGYVAALDLGVANGVECVYCVYFYDGVTWSPSGEVRTITPAYFAEPLYTAPDLADFLRERLASALAAEVTAGRLRHESGAVPILSAYPQIDQVRLPIVTVILQSRRPEVRAVGELAIPDVFSDADDVWSSYEGWLDRSIAQIGVVAINHEDRRRLRDAVQRVLMLNLPILDARGFTLPELSLSDTADFEQHNTPLYQSVFSLSCVHPALVRTRFDPIRSTEAIAHGNHTQ